MANTITADDIFKEFKQHSISEFFRKNSQMLGYAGKVRSLTTIVHEYTSNSVTYDTATVIMENGIVKIVKIGKFIDEKLSSNTSSLIQNGDVETLRELGSIQVLCFDKETLKLKFKKLRAVHRHRMLQGEKIYLIKTVGGREVEATRYHSMFTINSGNVVPIKTEELSTGKYLVVPSTGWLQKEARITNLNLIEEILKLSKEETDKISIYGVKEILYSNRTLLDKIKSNLSAKDRNYTFYAYYMQCDRLPINLIRNLNEDERKEFYRCRVGYKKGEHLLDNCLKVDSDLAIFLGLFTAEGSIRSNLNGCALSFGSNEKPLIEFANKLIKEIFNIDAAAANAHPTAINLTISSKFIVFLLNKIFGYGFNAKEKTIPDLIFNLNHGLAEQFLLGYLCGDGYPTALLFDLLRNKGSIKDINLKLTAATASKELGNRLVYLLSALGYSSTVGKLPAEDRMVKNVKAHFGESYRIDIWTKQAESPLKRYPITEGGIGNVVETKLKWAITNRNQQTVMLQRLDMLSLKSDMPESALKFASGDLGLLKVKNVSIRDPRSNEYVYDYSVDGDENFVGGYGPICLHNSLDACEEANILPEVTVEVKEISENKHTVLVRDNGPGIPVKIMGRVLATVLAGTKFHRYIQQRGQQGIGGSGVTLFSEITTGKPIHIRSGPDRHAFECDLTIDIKANKPLITNMKELDTDSIHGLEVFGEFGETKYENSDHGVFEYIRRTALSNPHATIKLVEPNGKESIFIRSVEAMPKKPKQTKPHPLGITTNDLREFAHASASRKISSFLMDTFSRVSQAKVDELRSIVANLDFDKEPQHLSWEEAELLVKGFSQVKWIAPDLDSLSTIGGEQIKLAMRNILNPSFMSVIERRPKVFRGGIPFVVEAGIAYGGNSGRQTEEGVRGTVLRFANKVPLLFDGSACAITEAVSSIQWKRYGIKSFDEEPLSVFVNISSVYVPYSGVGKQAVSQEPEIIDEIKLAVMDSARMLQRHISGERNLSVQTSRYNTIMRYVNQLSLDLNDITGKSKDEIASDLKRLIERRYKKLFDEEQKALKEREEANAAEQAGGAGQQPKPAAEEEAPAKGHASKGKARKNDPKA